MMMVYAITNTAIAAVALGLGALVLSQKSDDAAYQSFFLFATGVALSAVAKPFFWEDEHFLAILFVWWGFEIMVLGVFSMVHVFPGGRLNRQFLWSLAPWFLLFSFTPLLLVAASFQADPAAFFWVAYRATLPFVAVVVGGYLAASIFLSVRRPIHTFGLPLFLARGLIFIVISSAAAICAADLVLPALDIFRFAPVSNLFAVAILILGGSIVVRYGTGNGSALLYKGIPYFLSLVSVAILFVSVEFAIEKFFYHNDRIIDIATAALGALAFCPLRDFFNDATDRLFLRSPYHFPAAARELGERLSVSPDRDSLLAIIAEFFHTTIRSTETVFFAVSACGGEATLIAGLAEANAIAEDYSSLAALFLKHAHHDIIVTDATRLFRAKRARERECACGSIKEQASRLGIAAVVPVVAQGKVRIIMMIGHKFSGALLTQDDKELLGFIARRASITLENLELYELMREQAEKLEQRVIERTKRLKSMYESQSKFLADVSHEFKTPLAILKMHAGVFAASKDAEEKRAWYVMDATLDRLSRMVGNLLDVTKQCSSQHGLRKKRILVKELLQETESDCAMLAEDKGIRLYFSSENFFVLGERDRLKEVILNLLSNALRHTPAGGSISLVARESDGEAEIVVRDTGRGISRENMPHIFERFYRIGDSDFAGTGIGLYLCRQIIEGHGGTITAESSPGKGSWFTVRLPLSIGGP